MHGVSIDARESGHAYGPLMLDFGHVCHERPTSGLSLMLGGQVGNMKQEGHGIKTKGRHFLSLADCCKLRGGLCMSLYPLGKMVLEPCSQVGL